MKDKYTTRDVRSYSLFVNIEKKYGKVEGHEIILNEEQKEKLLCIMFANKDTFKVKEFPLYEEK